MITIAGAGVAGLSCALELARHGAKVEVFEKHPTPSDNTSSWLAGGMLAPWCEGETAEPEVVRLGASAANWWGEITPVTRHGTLVVAPPRDRAEITRFARRTDRHKTVDRAEIAALEPALAQRFTTGLFFADEAHLDPRQALLDLADAACGLGVTIHYGTPAPAQVDVDCRGTAAQLPGLRAQRGEMAVIEAPDVELTRTIRLLHPRIPLYIVPRADGVYMIGATMIEGGSDGPVTVRSMLELLGAAFTLHPGFGEARVVETNAGLRPAFANNMPQVLRHDGTLHINGLYRHGFLLAPALACQVAQTLLQDISDDRHTDHPRQRRTA